MHQKEQYDILGWIILRCREMKRGYYIHFEGRASVGISKKLDMQIDEFGKYFDISELEVETVKRNLAQRVIGLLPMLSITRNYAEALEKLDHPDFIYVRRNVADKAYVNFWKEIKRRYPQCKIIIEIFTYPYDKDDFGKWNAWPFYIKEIIYRPQLKKYVDRFVTYSADKEIFGVPTIITTNGIDVEKVKIVEGSYKDNIITLIGVAYMQRHHGYERLIRGLWDYYQKRKYEYKVELLLIGDGPEKSRYQKMVEKYRLQEYVKFFPTMSGEKLDEMYDMSDIALASFGMYKLGIYEKLGALKTRECLAKGMPLITGCEIEGLGDDYIYVKNFPNNDQTVNVEEIVNFFVSIKEKDINKETVARTIREFATEHVSMRSVMEPIVSYIES